MTARYFICNRPQTNGSHTVHKEDCPFLPESGERTLMGTFKSPHNALKEGSIYFSKATSCVFCSKKLKSGWKNHEFAHFHGDIELVSSRQLKVNLECSLFYSVN